MEEIFEGRISCGSGLFAKFSFSFSHYFQGVNKNLFSEGIFFRGYCHNI